MNKLDRYNDKRDFDTTPEPRGEAALAGGTQASFVVQKHDASSLHFDFRLEWDGVLLSWAVTKGPSDDPSEKRLAVRTEDHPVAYGSFEGTIPEDEYGGGTVMLWDSGAWEPLHDVAKGLKEGKLHFRLHGARMEGGWALVKMGGGKGDRDNWLLIKERDDFAGRSADALVNKYKRSVTTGRTMREIAADTPAFEAVMHKKALPRFRKVELATLKDEPPVGEGWQHEVKFDGYRCLMAVGKGGVRLYTRNGKDWSDRFGALCGPADALPCDAALIDGEVVAERGGFSELQAALKAGDPLVFHAFDCLHLDGDDLTGKPLSERREALEGLFGDLPPRGPLRLSPVLEGDGAEALAAMCKAGGEGIVSKKIDAPYSGKRSKAWIKAKCIQEAEFVVGGWSPSDKKGRAFSSLLLGSYEDEGFVYRGRVGTGFDDEDFEALAKELKRLGRKTAPFEGDLPSETKGAHWVTPELVAQVEYTEFTSEGRIRHGAYKGLREDKEAENVSAKAEAETDSGDEEIGGVRVSSTGRVMFPDAGLTKGDVARHYARVAERMLEHVEDRPLSLLRCPDGIEEECFFQKHAGKGFPEDIRTVPIKEKDGDTADYMYVTTPAGLIGAAQMGAVEYHVWGARRDKLERPDRMVFDLDPDEGLGFDEVKRAAVEVREGLEACGLQSVPMVTGGKGVHVIVPLRRIAEWDRVKDFAKGFAQALAEKEPKRYTATMSKEKRKGKLFIDWLRNERGATAIAPYSLRARPGAAVAVPVNWDELEALDRPDGFHVGDMEDRLSRTCPLGEVDAQGLGKGAMEALEEWAG